MKRVTGLGGALFKSEDPTQLKSWYEKQFGVNDIFKWIDLEKPEKPQAKISAQTIWSPLKKTLPIFLPVKSRS